MTETKSRRGHLPVWAVGLSRDLVMNSFLCKVVLILLWFQERDIYDPPAAGALDLDPPFCAGGDIKQPLMTVAAVYNGGRHLNPPFSYQIEHMFLI